MHDVYLYTAHRGTATTEQPTTSNQTTAPEPVDVTIPTDRGGFVDQTESQPLTTKHPAEEIGIAITAASVVFDRYIYCTHALSDCVLNTSVV